MTRAKERVQCRLSPAYAEVTIRGDKLTLQIVDDKGGEQIIETSAFAGVLLRDALTRAYRSAKEVGDQ